MKLTTPEIVWHNKQPLLSADFYKGGSILRLATGGADNDVKIWKISEDDSGDKLKIVFLASLSRHTKAVNVVRFSPNGEFLASAGDDMVVHIWKMDDSTNGSTDGNLVNSSGDSSPSKNKENWTIVKLLRGHLEDVYDLCWSPDSTSLVSGSVDNSAIVWDVIKGQQTAILKDSRQYVQGVTWDPCGEYVVTLSNDRNLRVYSVDQKFKCVHTVNKMSLGDSKSIRLWVDEVNSFFRRLTFTPDGSFLIAPAGRFENGDKVTNASYIFTRTSLTKPVLQLPGTDKASVIVRCCPVLFELREQSDNATPLTSLPYRMVYAVASLDSVFLYDTQHTAPFAYISKIHYSGITDLAWSGDGSALVVTSSDCYCTIVTFEPNELGAPLPTEKLPPCLAALRTCLLPSRPSPPLSKSDSHTDKGSHDDDVMITSPSPHPSSTDNSIKQRRIRPTMVTTVTSPNNPTPPSVTVPNQTVCSPNISSSTSQNASSALASQSTQSSTSSVVCSTTQIDRTTVSELTESPVISSDGMDFRPNGMESRPTPEKQGPRRVAFTTLSSFPSPSSKVSAGLTSNPPAGLTSNPPAGLTSNPPTGSTSSGQENCIVIE